MEQLTDKEKQLLALVKERKVLPIRLLTSDQIVIAEELTHRGILQKISTHLNTFYYAEIIRPCHGTLADLPTVPFQDLYTNM